MEKKKETKKEEPKELTPSQYFNHIKELKQNVSLEGLKKSYETFITLAEKYNKLGQIESLKKLSFLANTLSKEEKLIELGVTTFVYKDTIEEYIEKVAGQAVKIIELSRYMREIPDELVETVEKTKTIFDEFYVLFTDYTGKEERKVEKERRDKDPILFGVFKNEKTNNVADRFYFLGDWVDEYCDLTLDKMIGEFQKQNKPTPVRTVNVPSTTEELINVLESYQIKDKKDSYIFEIGTPTLAVNAQVPKFTMEPEVKKQRFFDKVRSVFKK